jgi:hypothetical protein
MASEKVTTPYFFSNLGWFFVTSAALASLTRKRDQNPGNESDL